MLKLLRHLKAYLLTTLFFVKTFLVDCQGGVGTFLNRKVHNDAEPVFLDLGYWNIFKLKVILFCRYLLKDASLFQDWYQSTCDRIVKRLDDRDIPKEQLDLTVDTYKIDEIEAEKFFQDYLLKSKPVVLKQNALEGDYLFSEKYFLEHYGSTKVSVNDIKTAKQTYRTLKEYLLDDDPDRIEYIRASTKFVSENADFFETLNPQQFDT